MRARSIARTTSFRLVAAAGLTSCAMTALAAETQISLNYNFNGMASPSETGNPDAPDGFRSISDRALYLDGNVGSFATGPVVGEIGMAFGGGVGINYAVNTTPNTLDIVHLGNRSVGGWPYDASADGDNIGIRPSWDTNPDHTTPQTTNVSPGIPMYASSQVGVLYQISNGGGSFRVRLGFSDGSSASATLAGPDWYNLPAVQAPAPGVFGQLRHTNTNFPATTTNDSAVVGVVPTNNLSVFEGVIGIAQMAADGLGNHAGKTLTSITFENADYAGSNARAYAIIAATVRGEPLANPLGSGSISPAPAAAGQPAVLRVATFRADAPNSAISSVTIDGSSIGLAASIAMNDAGADGDTTPGDGVYAATVTIPAGAPASAHLEFVVRDASNRIGQGAIDFGIVIPPTATDFGTIANGTSTHNDTIEPGAIKWLRFTLGTGIDRSAGTYLDIDTEGSVTSNGTALADDTMLGLYTAGGSLVTFDDDDGSGYHSQLSYGLDNPARPAVGNGIAYNGRDGAILAAGTYYLAYTSFQSVFGATNWNVTTTHGHTGTYVINFNTNAGGDPGCPADLDDDGSLANGGTRDGAVTIEDLIFFLAGFEEGSVLVDLDNDGEPTTGTPDGAVTIEDLIFFLARFENGC